MEAVTFNCFTKHTIWYYIIFLPWLASLAHGPAVATWTLHMTQPRTGLNWGTKTWLRHAVTGCSCTNLGVAQNTSPLLYHHRFKRCSHVPTSGRPAENHLRWVPSWPQIVPLGLRRAQDTSNIQHDQTRWSSAGRRGTSIKDSKRRPCHFELVSLVS